MNNDRITELYKGDIGPPDSQRRARARIHWLCTQVAGTTVLDIGCSQGIASILLAREGHRVTGVDIETAALDYAREQLGQEEPHVSERVTFEFAEAADLPYEDGSFDTVLMGELLEHQLDPAPLLREARRVLAPDGLLAITFPYGIFRYPDHKEPLYLGPIIEQLEAGFAIERVEVVERWVGLVASAVREQSPKIQRNGWVLAMKAAESRLAEIDTLLEERRETLKATQSRLADARQERDEAKEQILQDRAHQSASAKEVSAARARVVALEEALGADHAARLEVERRLAAAEGRLEAAVEHAAGLRERADAQVQAREHEDVQRTSAELAAATERAERLAEEAAGAQGTIAELRELVGRHEADAESARRAAHALEEDLTRVRRELEQELTRARRELERSEQLVARQREEAAANRQVADELFRMQLELAETRAERDRALEQATQSREQVAQAHGQLELAREHIEHLAGEREAQDRLLRLADDRAAALGRELAATTVELQDAHERLERGEDGPPDTERMAEPRDEAGSGPHLDPPAPPPDHGGAHEESRNGAVAAESVPRPTPPPSHPEPEPAPEMATATATAVATAEDPAQTSRLGREALKDGDYDAAAAAFAAAIEQEPDRASHWLGLARANRGLRRYTDAMEAVERARELRPGWRDALWQALWITSRLDDPAGFVALATELGEPAAASARDLERLGPLALRAGAHELAQGVGERLIALDPLSQPGLLTLACGCWELGDEERAAEVIAGARASGDPRSVRAAIGYARHRDDLDEVPALLGELDPPDGKLLGDFAHMFARRGQPRVAIELLDRAEQVTPGEPRFAEIRSRAQEELKVHDGSWAQHRQPRRIEPRAGRVLHLVSHSLPHHTSGGTYRTHYLTRAQRDAGLEPFVATPLGFPWRAGVTEAQVVDELDGITYTRVPDDNPSDGGLAARLGRNLEGLIALVEELRPAVLHPHSDYLNALLALELRRLFGIPVVYEVRGFPEERLVRREGSRAFSDQSVGRRAMELECMISADRIVTLAEVMKRHIISRGVAAEKIHIMPNGVDPVALQPVPRDAGLARRLGFEDGETVLGYVSTFHGYEGIQFIVRATAELIRRGHRARALLVGDGRERPALEALAEQLGVADAVVFAGRVPHDEVLAYYGLIDLFICARRAEATSELVTPLKPFEAMAVECPVIVSDVGALREIVRDGETGRRFRPEDPIHLADIAETLIEDPSQRRRLAAAGREWVTTERTWDANGGRYRALYEELGVL